MYDWKNNNLIASAQGESKKSPSGRFFTRQLYNCSMWFWTISNFGGGRVERFDDEGAFLEKKGRIQPLLCIGWAGPFAVIGTMDGHLYRFEGHMLRGSLKAHDKSVTGLYSCADGIVSGGRDKRIVGYMMLLGLNVDMILISRNCKMQETYMVAYELYAGNPQRTH